MSTPNLDKLVALAQTREYDRVEHGREEHVGGYERESPTHLIRHITAEARSLKAGGYTSGANLNRAAVAMANGDHKLAAENLQAAHRNMGSLISGEPYIGLHRSADVEMHMAEITGLHNRIRRLSGKPDVALTSLERVTAAVLQLGAVRAYERTSSKGRLEHVSGFDRDSVDALEDHMHMASMAFERGDTEGAMKHLKDAQAHVKAGNGGGNAKVHGVKHAKGKHTQDALVDALHLGIRTNFGKD